MLKLSIVPNFDNRVFALDTVKHITVELRKLPALELIVSLSEGYPSSARPSIALKLFDHPDGEHVPSFYAQFRAHVMQSLADRWEQDVLCLYEYYCYI